MLGYHFARVVRDRGGSGAESALALFLKFEQLAAYCRYQVDKDGEFRGIERVKKALAGGNTVRLSARREDQILSNQKVYGLWGLFSVPSRASGLLDRNETVLTPMAEEFVEREYLARLAKEGFKDGREVVALLEQERPEVHLAGRHASLARTIARLHAPALSAAEREFYRESLAYGGVTDETKGLQRQLADLMRRLPKDTPFGRQQLRALIKEAGSLGSDWSSLVGRLQRIDDLESVLVPAGALFGLLQGRHGQSVESIAKDLGEKWGPLDFIRVGPFRELRAEIGEAFHEPSAGERWVRISEDLASGQYDEVLRLLIEHNAFVMGARGSQAWVRLTGGVLDVRFRDDVADLPPRKELPTRWVNNYFLNPLKEVVMTLAA